MAASGCAGRGELQTLPAPPAIAPLEQAVEIEPVTPLPASTGVEHTVLPGQTLWRIARTYGVPLNELADANGIDDPTRIEAGVGLFVPGARERLEVPVYRTAPGGTFRPAPVAGATGARGFGWPLEGGEILSGFGAPRKGRRHLGIDIRGRHGQPVLATAPGRVVYTGSSMRGYGLAVILDHGRGIESLYAHGSRLLVRRGQQVERGQPIALVGRTGNATGDHCHFEIRRGRVPVDPLEFIQGGSRP